MFKAITASASQDASTSIASIIARNSARSARSAALRPPLNALRLAVALPVAVLGPVDCFRGDQLRIASAWRCRRSKVHPWLNMMLQ